MVLEAHESIKIQLAPSEIHYSGGTRQNVLEMHELRRPDPCKEKPATVEDRAKRCLRCIS